MQLRNRTILYKRLHVKDPGFFRRNKNCKRSKQATKNTIGGKKEKGSVIFEKRKLPRHREQCKPEETTYTILQSNQTGNEKRCTRSQKSIQALLDLSECNKGQSQSILQPVSLTNIPSLTSVKRKTHQSVNNHHEHDKSTETNNLKGIRKSNCRSPEKVNVHDSKTINSNFGLTEKSKTNEPIRRRSALTGTAHIQKTNDVKQNHANNAALVSSAKTQKLHHPISFYTPVKSSGNHLKAFNIENSASHGRNKSVKMCNDRVANTVWNLPSPSPLQRKKSIQHVQMIRKTLRDFGDGSTFADIMQYAKAMLTSAQSSSILVLHALQQAMKNKKVMLCDNLFVRKESYEEFVADKKNKDILQKAMKKLSHKKVPLRSSLKRYRQAVKKKRIDQGRKYVMKS